MSGRRVIWLLLAACAFSCRQPQPLFRRLEIPAARVLAGLAQDGGGGLYFRKPNRSLRFGHRGRGLRLISSLEGPCCLDLYFWSPASGRLRLRARREDRGEFLAREFDLRRGFNAITVDLRLRRGDRLALEAEHDGVFSRPLLYRLLPASERRNIFLISADNLGADHLELYGYRRDTGPAISAFRRQAVLYRWAFANSPWTLPAHMSLFTSLHETEHGVTHRVLNEMDAAAGREEPMVRAFPLRPGLDFLVERLSRSFITCGFSGGINLGALFGFYRGFDLYAEAPDDLDKPRAAARLFARAEEHLLSRRFPAAFYFLHTYQVHLPYRPPPDLLERIDRPPTCREFDFEKDIGGISGIFRRGDARRPDDASALYDAEVMEFDRRFGEFIAFLKRSDLYNRAMIILLSDHGEEFFEHGSWAHGTDLFNSQVRVPLLVKFPGGRFAGRRVDGAISLVDVMPTVLDFYGIDVPPGMSGRSRLGELRGAPPPSASVFSVNLDCRSWLAIPPQAALIQGGYKLIRHLRRQDSAPGFFAASPPVFPARQLFHLADDPNESRDLAGELPQVAAGLDAVLQDFLDGKAGPASGRPQALPPEALEALRALGYIR